MRVYKPDPTGPLGALGAQEVGGIGEAGKSAAPRLEVAGRAERKAKVLAKGLGHAADPMP